MTGDATAPSDLTDLLRLRSGAARAVVALFVPALFTVMWASKDSYTEAWPPIVGFLILSAAAVCLVLVPGDPLDRRVAALLTVAGPVACALVLWTLIPGAGHSGRSMNWPHMAATAIFCFVSIRGRRVMPWIGMIAMIGVYWGWGAIAGQPPFLPASSAAIEVVPLAMATLLSLSIRPTALQILQLRQQARRRAIDSARQEAAHQERRSQLVHLEETAGPLLERISNATALSAEERRQCSLLEAEFRDRLRAPHLLSLGLEAAARSARRRGVEVVFIDDYGTEAGTGVDPDSAEARALSGTTDAVLTAADGGRVCVRILPSGRARFATVVTEQPDKTVLWEVAAGGHVTSTVVPH